MYILPEIHDIAFLEELIRAPRNTRNLEASVEKPEQET